MGNLEYGKHTCGHDGLADPRELQTQECILCRRPPRSPAEARLIELSKQMLKEAG